MSKLEDAPLVLIEWQDSFGCSTDWTQIKNAKDRKPPVCRSVGWLVVDGEHLKVIVPHVHDADEEIGASESGCGDMSIPTQAVIRIARLKEEADHGTDN